MRNTVGTSAGVLAAVAVLMHIFLSSPGEVKTGAASGNKQVAQPTSNDKPESSAEPVPPTQGPWLASWQYFHHEPPSSFKSSCVEYLVPHLGVSAQCDGNSIKTLFGLSEDFDPRQLTALMATIPDPLHTRMALSADRNLDAIQKGAFEAGWEMATQWLPWTAKSAHLPVETVSKKPGYIDPEMLPGLVVFRRKFNDLSVARQLLFVFVVGETPSAGVNGFQFEAAQHVIQLLGAGAKMRVLGPTFSGSFPSLTELIGADGQSHDYEIYAGSVSNSGYARSLLETLGKSKTVSFHGSTLPSASFDAQFRYWARRQGFAETQIAQLVEDGSGFSVGVVEAGRRKSGPKSSGLITFQYPRDIAQLREAYSDVAFADPVVSDSKATLTPMLSLKDAGAGESSFPIFSTNHTPVSQNVVLEQTVKEIRRHGIRLLSLSATNVFDTLFIANVLHKECPDARVVVSGADMLFVQQAAQNSLSGILAISPFPMFPDGFVWENASLRGMTFPDADSIGEYNATLGLLHADPKRAVVLAPPSGTGSYLSSAWVLVLGLNGWAPLDLLDQVNPSLGQGGRKWFDPASQAPGRSMRKDMPVQLSTASTTWTVLCLATTLISFLVCGRFLYLRWRTDIRTWSSLCSVDLLRGLPVSRLEHARYVCLLGALSSLTFLNGLVLTPMLDRDWQNWPLQLLTGFATVIPFLTGCYLMWQISNRCSYVAMRERPLTLRYVCAAFVIRLVILLLPLVCLPVWYRLCFYDGVRGSFFRFRVFSLDFSVSPIWPPFLAVTGLLIVSLFHLRRLTWASRQRPLLETSTLDRSLWSQLSEIDDTLHRIFSGPAASKPGVRGVGMTVILGVFIALVLVFPRESLRSFEPLAFEAILIALFLPLSLTVAGGFVRFALSWRTLRRLLSILNSLDVARFFKRLPDFDGAGPIWIRDLRMTSLATSVNSAIALHNLDLSRPRPLVKPRDYWNALSAFLSAPDRKQLLGRYKMFVDKAAEINKLLSDKVLLPFWQTERMPFVEASSAKEESSPALARAAAVGGSSRTSVSTPAQPAQVTREDYEMASQYVALQFSVFIGYALRHIQNLLLCSVLSFVLLVLALSSFSFQTPQAISRLILAGLIVGGVVVVRALAQIERNPIISRLSGTAEGTLGKDFYLQIVSYGALPVLAVIGTQFPAAARMLSAWVQPTLEALK